MKKLKRLTSIIAALALIVVGVAVAQTTQQFTNPYYTACTLDNNEFLSGQFDFIHYDANGVGHHYNFYAFAPSNLNNYTPQMEITGYLPLTDGTWTHNGTAYTFAASDSTTSATIAFTASSVPRFGCTVPHSSVTAALTQ